MEICPGPSSEESWFPEEYRVLEAVEEMGTARRRGAALTYPTESQLVRARKVPAVASLLAEQVQAVAT